MRSRRLLWGRSVLRTLRNRWINFPPADAGLFVVVVAGASIATGGDFGTALDAGSRHVWYQTLTGLAAGLLGVGVASVTILYAVSPGDRLRALLRTVGTRLARLFAISIGLVAASAVFFGLAIPFDPGDSESIVPTIALGVASVLVSNVGRLLWILHRVLATITRDVTNAGEASFVAPVISDDDYPVVRRRADEAG